MLFLTAAIWLARFAERAGVTDRMAARLWRTARGRPARLYVLTCLLCAALTATVSLDGAVVLMVPVLLGLTRRSPALRRTLLLGTVGVANAFSLALPQGNPTNLLVIQELGLTPAHFVAHLFLPALTATVVAAGAVALTERRTFRRPAENGAQCMAAPAVPRSSAAAPLAVAALATAALAGAAAPWLGIAPWWTLCGVAVATVLAARITGCEVPAPEVPWRISAQVTAVVLAFACLPGLLAPPTPELSPALLVAVALGAAAVAGVANNLPATVALAGLLGAAPIPAYAALTGLSVGALATPQGSVATLIAFQRAGDDAPPTRDYLKLWLPGATAATVAATLLLATTG